MSYPHYQNKDFSIPGGLHFQTPCLGVLTGCSSAEQSFALRHAQKWTHSGVATPDTVTFSSSAPSCFLLIGGDRELHRLVKWRFTGTFHNSWSPHSASSAQWVTTISLVCSLKLRFSQRPPAAPTMFKVKVLGFMVAQLQAIFKMTRALFPGAMCESLASRITIANV